MKFTIINAPIIITAGIVVVAGLIAAQPTAAKHANVQLTATPGAAAEAQPQPDPQSDPTTVEPSADATSERAGVQTPATQAENAPVITAVGDPVETYVQSTSNPAMQDAYCQYSFSDGSTQLVWEGSRMTPGPGVVYTTIECPVWHGQ